MSMRIKDGFVLRDVADQTVVIATGDASKSFHGMIKLNATGRDIWKGLEAGLSDEEIAQQLTAKYEVDDVQARQDVQAFVEQARQAGFLA